jgi:uncharacterized protein with PQ loop repeat
MDRTFPVLAGAVSSVIFACSTLPMLVKAARTKDLSSYSLGNILLSNLGNVVHSVYVFHLPAGPIWALHTFYLLSTAMMLVWYLRYTGLPIPWRRLGLGGSPDATSSLGGLASWLQAARPHHAGR